MLTKNLVSAFSGKLTRLVGDEIYGVYYDSDFNLYFIKATNDGFTQTGADIDDLIKVHTYLNIKGKRNYEK